MKRQRSITAGQAQARWVRLTRPAARRRQLSRLGRGLTLASIEMPQMSSVSMGIWVGVGSRYEPLTRNGVCHFIEHLLFKGTCRRSAREISEAVEGIGGYLNAFTSEESTCFHARVSAEHFEAVLDVLLDMLCHSRFVPGDIRKEREVIKEEIAMCLDEPQHQVQEVLNETMWPGHPLGRPITGTPAGLNHFRRPELVGYLRQNYVAANTVIVATGRVRHSQLEEAVGRYADEFGPSPRPAFAAAPGELAGPRRRLVTRRVEQAQVALGIRTCSRHDPRRYALRLLNAILGENMSSRLFQAVREDRGLAYNIYSTPSFYADAGDLVISMGLDSENLGRALRLVLREMRRLAEEPVSASELRRARDYAIGQINLGLESTETQMNWAGEQLLGYGRMLSPEKVKERLAAVTQAEIRAAARDFFVAERLHLAVVSPLKESDFDPRWLKF